MDEFMNQEPFIICEQDFDDIFNDNVDALIKLLCEDDMLFTDDAEEEMYDLITYAKHQFFTNIMPPRQNCLAEPIKKPVDQIQATIKGLDECFQPKQRTPEWYEYRYNLITASDAYKAFESQSVQNSLIYNKCKPLATKAESTTPESNDEDVSSSIPKPVVQVVNTNTTLHWGQKYEPLSVLIYEKFYDTKIGEYGCIQHEAYPFIGASPDGLNIKQDSPKFGRLLEIKNIVNREISGIPKKEYWIQMQLQMEVCDIDECDFLETKFTEYADYSAYKEDNYLRPDGSVDTTRSADDKLKGVIIHFHGTDGSPLYVYKPLDIIADDAIDEWTNQTIATYEKGTSHIFMKFIYWKMDVWSCVLVLRNRQWFKNAIPVLSNLWDTIKVERISGCEHRAPNRRTKIDKIDMSSTEKSSGGCLLLPPKDAKPKDAKPKDAKMNVIKMDASV
jgi:putative phage-type endonuclease